MTGRNITNEEREKAGRGCIRGHMDIAERPTIVEEKSRVGDWEVDTMIGKEHKGAVVSMAERHSKWTLLTQVSRKTAHELGEALKNKLGEVADCVLTIPADNRKEFTDHEEVPS